MHISLAGEVPGRDPRCCMNCRANERGMEARFKLVDCEILLACQVGLRSADLRNTARVWRRQDLAALAPFKDAIQGEHELGPTSLVAPHSE